MNFYIENLTDILLCLNYSVLADPRPHIFIFVWKMMNFANRARVENQYGIKFFLIFHSQKHSPFTLKWWAKFFFQKDEFLYGVPHQPFVCDVTDVTITSKVRWKNLCIFKKFRDPTKPIFQFKKRIFCNFGPRPIYWARRDFRFWGVIFSIWIKIDQVMKILSFCLTNCIPINRNLHNFFVRIFL